jgi:AGCS family alanine or glycine:cation symporter
MLENLNIFAKSIESLLFFNIFGVPFVILWLGAVSVFFTVRLRFINVFGVKHAFDILIGKFNGEKSKDEISPFKALMSSMAATIGTGSIVGVAVAVSKGGPGAVFWMMMFGFFGMALKCAEVFLGHRYRKINEDGTIIGGPFIYLKDGLAEMGYVKIGKALAFLFLIFCIVGLFGMSGFQTNQVVTILTNGQEGFTLKKIIYSLALTAFCAYIIIGGVQRVSSFASVFVPMKIGLYVGAVLLIIISHPVQLVDGIKLIFTEAFNFSSGMTAFFAMVAIGARRALMACEAGLGTSPIVNASSNVKYSQRQGILNIFDPFVTTWFVCVATSLVLIMSGFYLNTSLNPAILVRNAFSYYHEIFGYVVIISIIIFGVATVFSVSYYFMQAGKALKIPNSVLYVFFFTFLFLSGILQLDLVIAFTDILLVFMTIINTIGLYFLSGKIAREFKEYFAKNKNDKD